jgi:hypothetical protein
MIQPVRPEDGDESNSGADTLLPSQFWAAAADPRTEPEKRLMIAVLEEAIGLVVNGAGESAERSAAVHDAERWFASDERRGTFTFATICDVLGLDVGRVRQAVAGWRRRAHVFRRPRVQSGRGRHQVRGRDRSRDPRRAA